MLIDHPEVGREFFAAEGVYPTHEGAAAIFTSLSGEMDGYSEKYGRLADAAWEDRRREGEGKRISGGSRP